MVFVARKAEWWKGEIPPYTYQEVILVIKFQSLTIRNEKS